MPERRDELRRQDPHVAGEDDQVGRVRLERLEQPREVLFRVVGREPEELQAGFLCDALQVAVVGEDADEVAVELAVTGIFNELLEALGLLADQERDLLSAPLAVQMDADLHVHPPAQVQQAGDQLGQVDADVLEVHQHVHQEEATHDALLDVLDVDAALGHVGGELRDDPFLVFPQHADDG